MRLFENSQAEWYNTECKEGKSMGIDIREYSTFRQEEIYHLYESVGWTNYTAQSEKLEQMYRNSNL